jgi:hypothetical protein
VKASFIVKAIFVQKISKQVHNLSGVLDLTATSTVAALNIEP